MVWHSIGIEVGVDQFSVHSVTHRAVWSSVYVIVQEGKVAIWLSLHDKLDVGMYAIDVVKEVI
jgi:hypothetical protein